MFECTACGKCCKGSWNIGVDQEAYKLIQQTQSYKSKKKEGYIPLVVAEDGEASVGRKKNGACVFLDEQNLCDVHGEVGLLNKPLVCQTYPNLFTNTPDGYFVSLSFACPAVLNRAGQPMTEKRERFQTMIRESGTAVPQNMPLTDTVKLTEDRTIAWSEYRQLEQHLMEGFKPSQPAASLLSMAEQLAYASTLGGLSDILQNGFAYSEPSGSAQELLELFSLHSLVIGELEEEPESRADFMGALMTGQGVDSTRHGCRLEVFDWSRKADIADLNLIHYYFENIVFGKRLTTQSLLDGLLTLAVGMALLVYYLKAFRGQFDERTAREKAFEVVEGDVVTHSRGLHVLLNEFPKALLGYAAAMKQAA